jgi:hypothetical protein
MREVASGCECVRASAEEGAGVGGGPEGFVVLVAGDGRAAVALLSRFGVLGVFGPGRRCYGVLDRWVRGVAGHFQSFGSSADECSLLDPTGRRWLWVCGFGVDVYGMVALRRGEE